ncbi:MAG TPA: EAL domain-containing protein [Thermoanaerobaculia bacterium]|nr:EAL domain-containing protein [Thermoanaerobaculia bacterium]
MNGEGVWFLEAFQVGRGAFRIPIRPLPFRVGRRAELDLAIAAPGVSQDHAEIEARDGRLWVRDLGSTNGTFLNGTRVAEPRVLLEGDVLHFADQEYRVVAERSLEEVALGGTLQLSVADLATRMSGGRREIEKLIAERALTPVFQPIVDLATGRISGYETLCRGELEGLPSQPGELFTLAASFGLENQLSETFRDLAAETSRRLGPTRLFFNTHPHELDDPQALLASLARLAGAGLEHELVLEIHEAAVTDPTRMKQLAGELRALGLKVAYDDFGAGRARLLELVEVPPDYLKFDMSLIRHLEQASEGRRKMLTMLVDVAKGLHIPSIAEGIETQHEAEAAREIGFELAQGFLWGRPRPA